MNIVIPQTNNDCVSNHFSKAHRYVLLTESGQFISQYENIDQKCGQKRAFVRWLVSHEVKRVYIKGIGQHSLKRLFDHGIKVFALPRHCRDFSNIGSDVAASTELTHVSQGKECKPKKEIGVRTRGCEAMSATKQQQTARNMMGVIKGLRRKNRECCHGCGR